MLKRLLPALLTMTLLLCVCASPIFAEELEPIRPSFDAYVNINNAKQPSTSGQQLLNVQSLTNSLWTYFKFNVTTIPQGMVISKATLYAYCTAKGGVVLPIGAYTLTDSNLPMDICGESYNEQNGYNGLYDPKPENALAFCTPELNAWSQWDLTSLITENGDYAICLAELSLTMNTVSFASMENATPTNRPYLKLEYADAAVKSVVSSITPGLVEAPQTVSLSCDTAGAEIRYTTDSTEPTENSALFDEPLTITGYTMVKAKAFKDGLTPSPTASFEYYPGIKVYDTSLLSHAPGVLENDIKNFYTPIGNSGVNEMILDGDDKIIQITTPYSSTAQQNLYKAANTSAEIVQVKMDIWTGNRALNAVDFAGYYSEPDSSENFKNRHLGGIIIRRERLEFLSGADFILYEGFETGINTWYSLQAIINFAGQYVDLYFGPQGGAIAYAGRQPFEPGNGAFWGLSNIYFRSQGLNTAPHTNSMKLKNFTITELADGQIRVNNIMFAPDTNIPIGGLSADNGQVALTAYVSTANNAGNGTVNAMFVIAQYDDFGKLISVKAPEVAIPTGSNMEEIPFIADCDNATVIKVFVWKNDGSISPLCARNIRALGISSVQE
ncbi:MAG: chitobiase/beta-hexosaminidase C-terminal domain-containing protein [Firmicutes bacterium]|nr:chitobiase/beta-hexosaminidase C-terminal domain-containing protein [Bacillota bacterium]